MHDDVFLRYKFYGVSNISRIHRTHPKFNANQVTLYYGYHTRQSSISRIMKLKHIHTNKHIKATDISSKVCLVLLPKIYLQRTGSNVNPTIQSTFANEA